MEASKRELAASKCPWAPERRFSAPLVKQTLGEADFIQSAVVYRMGVSATAAADENRPRSSP